jgi:predicted DsbA family dithiol-disulfide isomerase
VVDILPQIGIDPQTTRRKPHEMEEFKEAEELSRQHGVGGVPFFIINSEITLSGA